MSVHFKILGDVTPQHDGQSLCETCRFAHIVKFRNKGAHESLVYHQEPMHNNSVVRCGASVMPFGGYGGEAEDLRYDAGSFVVHGNVFECTGYRNKTLPSINEYSKVALIVDPTRSRTTGFLAGTKDYAEKQDAVEAERKTRQKD